MATTRFCFAPSLGDFGVDLFFDSLTIYLIRILAFLPFVTM